MIVARLRVSFDLLVCMLFAFIVYEANSYQELARIFPFYIGLAGVVLALSNLAFDVTRIRKRGMVIGEEELSTAVLSERADPKVARAAFQRVVRYVGWILGLVLLIWIIGILPAAVVFIVLFLKVEAHRSWVLIVIGSAVTLAGLMLLRSILNIRWPASLIELPWF